MSNLATQYPKIKKYNRDTKKGYTIPRLKLVKLESRKHLKRHLKHKRT